MTSWLRKLHSDDISLAKSACPAVLIEDASRKEINSKFWRKLNRHIRYFCLKAFLYSRLKGLPKFDGILQSEPKVFRP